MPLIKCPMCGKEISPNAVACPNCGEPMKKNQEQSCNKYCIFLEDLGDSPLDVKNKMVDLLNIDMETAVSVTAYLPYLILDNLDLEEAKVYKDKLEGVGAVISIDPDRRNSPNAEYKNVLNYIQENHSKDAQNVENDTIKCPNCKSTNVKKISGLSKISSVALFGIFSIGKLTKTYQCKKCGYRW